MKRIKYIFSLALAMMILSSCFDEPGTEILFDDSFVELDAATTGSGSKDYTFLRTNTGTTYSAGFVVNRAATSASSDVAVNFEIDASSTAIENVHYSLSGSSVTIPSGSYSAELPITILADNIEAGERLTIVVNLTSADIPLSDNYSSGTHTVQISCESDLAGTYSTVASGGFVNGSGTPGAGGSYSGLTATVTMTVDPANPLIYTFDDMSFGLYEQGYGDASPSGRVQDICGSLSDRGDVDQYSDPFTISGSVDPATGVITLSWSNTWGDFGDVVLTPQ